MLPINVPAESKTCPLPVGGQVFLSYQQPTETGKLL
jgi:hypothetical protein